MKDEIITDKDDTPIKTEDLELVSGGRSDPGSEDTAEEDKQENIQ